MVSWSIWLRTHHLALYWYGGTAGSRFHDCMEDLRLHNGAADDGLAIHSGDLYEAARIDGAGRWAELWHVTAVDAAEHCAGTGALGNRFVSGIRSVLHYDAGWPRGSDDHHCILDLHQLLHRLQTGLWCGDVDYPAHYFAHYHGSGSSTYYGITRNID